MAVGRISGPLLARNLFRDGVPLAFYNTSSLEPPVLYLDVINGRVGVRTDAPSYDLDVSGTINAVDILSELGQIGNLIFAGNTVTTDTGPITLEPSGLDNINLTGPVNIAGQTIINAALESKSVSEGSLIIQGGIGVSSNTNVGGNLTIYSTEQATDLDYDGSLVVKGGASIAKDLWVGGILHAVLSTSTVATISQYADNVKVEDPVLGLYYPMLAGDTTGYIAAKANQQFSFYLNEGKLTSPVLVVSSSTNSTSTNSGALQVAGGAGIAQDLYVGGNINASELVLNSTTESTSTTTGAFTVAGGVGIQGNLNVGGDIHAIGNITAEGNIQLGNSTGSDTLVVSAEIDSNLIPKTPSQYTVGTTTSSWAAGFFDTLYTNLLASQSGSINISPADNLLQINANIKVAGDRPIGTAPVVTNILYVTMDGSDTNDGRAEDPSRACRTISGALRSPFYGPGTSIKVAPGKYLEQNPLLLQPYTSVIGSDLRTTVIEAINKTQDLFHVQSGCYLFGMQFLNGRSGILPGTYAKGYNRGAYAVAFPPQVGGAKIDTFHSPYVQNCTNQTGPWMIDGIMFQPNQTVQVPLAVGTGTWPANTNTLVVTVSTGTITQGMSVNSGQQNPGFFNARTLLLANKPFIQEQVVAFVNQTYPGFQYQQAKCFRDVGIIVENVAYDSAFGGNEKSRESGLAYYDGVTSVIAGEESQTIAAINYINTLAQDIITNTPTTDLLGGLGTYSQVINTALVDGSIASTSIANNIDIITTIITNGTDYAPSVYKGAGPDAASVSAEILLQANRKFIQEDVMNWITNTYPDFVYNQDLCYRDVGLIVDAVSQDILLGGNAKTIEAALTYWEGGYNQITGQETTTTEAISHAKEISLKIINNEVVTEQAGYTYNKTKCERDTGLIVDAIAFDLLYGGTSQSAFAGLQYWSKDGYVGEIPSEITTTTSALSYLQILASDVATNAATNAEGTIVSDRFNNVIDILTIGTAGITDVIEPNGAASTDANVVAAYEALLAQKASLQTQVLEYINTTYPDFVYNQTTCSRDVGYIIDSVAFDLLHGGNKQSIMSGVYYYGFSATTSEINHEIQQTTGAYNFIKSISGKIVRGIPVTTTYQTGTVQVTSYDIARSNEVIQIENNIDLIVDIIRNGPSKAPAHVPIGLTPRSNQYVVNAYNLLLQNRDFIIAETTAYIDSLYASPSTQVINTYFENGYLASQAVARNFDIINGIIINGPDTAPTTYRGGGLFASTGVQFEETKYAPKVNSVVSLGGNDYRITLDTPTIGVGTNATLYFGNTTVFPVPDADIPDEWAERRIDPKGAMGGMLVDGSVVSDRSPVGSMVLNAFTQVAQGGRGIHIINNGYAQLVSIFTIFCNVAVECDTGGIASITNSNSNFGEICLVAKSYGKREFSGTIYNPPYPTNVPNGEYYPTGYWPQNGQIMLYVPDSANRPHIALIMEVEPPADFINDQGFPGFLTAAPTTSTLTTGSITIAGIDVSDIAIGQTLYVRDQYGRTTDGLGNPYVSSGTIITDVGYQEITLNKSINQGGGDSSIVNYFTLYTCGNAYYTVLSSNLTSNPVAVGDSIIPTSQQGPEVAALNFMDVIIQDVIANVAFTSTNTSVAQTIIPSVTGGEGAGTFISERLTTIGNIAQNGTGVAPTAVKTGTIPSGAGSAVTLINANIDFIAAEVAMSIPGLDYNQASCSRDTGLIVDAMAQDLLFNGTSQSTFAGLQYWNQNGLIGQIPVELSTTTAAVNYLNDLAQKIVLGDTSGTRYQNTVSQVVSTPATSAEATTIGSEFGLILDIINNGTVGVTDRIVPNGITAISDSNVVNAYTLLQDNKDYFKAEVVAYVEQTQLGFQYNVAKCERDTGIILDALVLDLAFPTAGYSQSTFAGLQYWSQTGYTGLIPDEITTTTNAISHLKDLAKKIIVNDTSGSRYSGSTQITNVGHDGGASDVAKIESEFNLILGILSTGTSGITDLIDTPGITPSGTAGTQNAYYLLQANRSYMQDEILAYISATAPLFNFDHPKCIRDIGYILDSVSFDLLYGGNRQAIQSGVYYYQYTNDTSAVAGEVDQVVAAFGFVKSLVRDIAKGDPYTPLQTTVAFTTGTSGTSVESDILAAEVDVIIDIIANGPSVAPTKEPISLNKTIDANALNVLDLLLANKDFIVAETTAWIRNNLQFRYDASKCARDVGFMVDSISFDLLYGGNRQAIQSGVYYYDYNASSPAINPNEYGPIQGAYSYIKQLVPYIIQGNAAPTYQTVVAQDTGITPATLSEATTLENSVDYMLDIIINGPSVAGAKEPISLTASVNSNVVNAAQALIANKEFIKAEVIAYLNANYLTSAAKELCTRDVKLILQQLIYDLETGGNYYSVYSGLSYWSRPNTYHIVQLGENVNNPRLMPNGATVNFYQRSYMSASGYTFEYVGAGLNYGSLPQVGRADPIQSKEVVQLDNGKVFFTSTDQNGDFRIGPGLVISQATGVLSGRTFTKSLFANLTPFILAIEAGI